MFSQIKTVLEPKKQPVKLLESDNMTMECNMRHYCDDMTLECNMRHYCDDMTMECNMRHYCDDMTMEL